VRNWQCAPMTVIAMLVAGCACPSPTGLGKNFSYLRKPPEEILRLTAAEPDRRLFHYRSAKLPYHFDDVWTAVHKALNNQNEPIVREDESAGVIYTLTASHGMFYYYSNKYYITINEKEPGTTTITYQYFRYEVCFPDPNHPLYSEDRPVRKADLMLCRCQLFEKGIVDSLPPQ
jgi:hypothetical protein